MLAAEWRTVIQTLGTSVRELRQTLGWSQNDLAARAVISQGAVSRLESGTKLNLPLHSVVVAVRALAQEAPHLDTELTGPIRALLAFSAMAGAITRPLDRDLVALLQLYHGLPRTHRQALLAYLQATAPSAQPVEPLGPSDGTIEAL